MRGGFRKLGNIKEVQRTGAFSRVVLTRNNKCPKYTTGVSARQIVPESNG
jgi:hypothetical protein